MNGVATTCRLPECDKPARGSSAACSMHKTRMARHGNYEGLRPEAPAPERFARYVDTSSSESGCWLWTSALNSNGYGVFWPGPSAPSHTYAHRWSYEHHVGPIPAGLHVRHSCDTPACVNPAHLSLGTMADNMRDKVERGRSRRATCFKGHEWTAENTNYFTDARGFQNRRCRKCRRDRERKAT